MGTVILDRSIQGMVDQLETNLFEDELVRKMDFGHTFSYGLETSPDSQWLHGEAVLTDMLISAMIARNRNLLYAAELDRILALVSRLGILPNAGLVDPDVLWASLEERTLHRNGWQRIPLPHGIGDCIFVNDVKPGEIKSACREMLESSRK